jgi:hypothetical protein
MKQTSMSGACQEMRGRGGTAEALTVENRTPSSGPVRKWMQDETEILEDEEADEEGEGDEVGVVVTWRDEGNGLH